MEFLYSLKYGTVQVFSYEVSTRFIILPIIFLLIMLTLHFMVKHFSYPKKYYRRGYKSYIPFEVADNHYKMWDWISKQKNLFSIWNLKMRYLESIKVYNIKNTCFLCHHFKHNDDFCHNCPLYKNGKCYLYEEMVDADTNREKRKLAKQIRDSVLC